MKEKTTITPSLEETKAALENKYQITLHARTIKDALWESGRHRLTQYSPLLIDIWYPAATYLEEKYYSLFIAKNEHTIPFYDSGLQLLTWEEMLRVLGKYAKPRVAEQTRLF